MVEAGLASCPGHHSTSFSRTDHEKQRPHSSSSLPQQDESQGIVTDKSRDKHDCKLQTGRKQPAAMPRNGGNGNPSASRLWEDGSSRRVREWLEEVSAVDEFEAFEHDLMPQSPRAKTVEEQLEEDVLYNFPVCANSPEMCWDYTESRQEVYERRRKTLERQKETKASVERNGSLETAQRSSSCCWCCPKCFRCDCCATEEKNKKREYLPPDKPPEAPHESTMVRT